MPQVKITYNQVEKAINNLFMTGQKITVNNVHVMLGNVGSHNTVARHLREWKAKNPNFDKIPLNQSTPEVIAEPGIVAQIQQRQEELKRSYSLVRATLESTADGILMINNQGKMVDWNQKFLDILKIPRNVLENEDETVGLKYILSQIEDPQELMMLMMQVQQNPECEGDMGWMRFKSGQIIERYSQPQRVGSEIVGRVWSFRDVTKRRQAEEDLRLRQRAIEASTHGVIITDSSKELKIIYANQVFGRITGYTHEEIVGKNCRFLQNADREQKALQEIRAKVKIGAEVKAILRNYRKDGTLFWNELHIAPVQDPDGSIKHYVGIIHDITERKAMEAQLVHQATHDSLTDLPNRILLTDRVNQAITFARREQTVVAVMFLDLDRFKFVNDSLGHKMGDALLIAVAERLKKCVRESDTVARLGGDEFVVVLPDLHRDDESIYLSQVLLRALKQPFFVEERELNISTSIGISCFPRDGTDVVTLIKNADTAMYHAKELGRNNFQFFTAEMNYRVSQRLALENSLHGALERNEMVVYFQPIIELVTGKVSSLEALLRWNHPSSGMISPMEFIPLAEETGLIVPIGEWVLSESCVHLKRWQNMGMTELSVAVNISGRQFKHSDLVGTLEKVLYNTQLDPRFLTLELTESMLMDTASDTLKILKNLKKMNLTLAIDDFGTGYSSLSYLKRFPADKLKIDKSFVHDIGSDSDDMAITLAILAMSKSLNLKVVAEGVETKKELNFLRAYQCDEVQGYYFSKPLAAEDCTKFLLENDVHRGCVDDK